MDGSSAGSHGTPYGLTDKRYGNRLPAFGLFSDNIIDTGLHSAGRPVNREREHAADVPVSSGDE
ncbi:hypothetical protein ONO23_03144 [Micromonospora noduli]|nr:hypothetical protein ONO23_03144 [Micromonospora noduli]